MRLRNSRCFGLVAVLCVFAGAPVAGAAATLGTVLEGSTSANPLAADAAQAVLYSLDRYTIDDGGGQSSGGIFTIEGTIGQADADPLQPATGGVFEITGGYWSGLTQSTTPQPELIFADGFE